MILVTGGAGYIGSHYVLRSLEQGEEIVALDNLSYGHKEATLPGATLIIGEMSNAALLEDIFQQYSIEAVVHFAAFAFVGESVLDPAKYYNNNTVSALNVLDTMRKFGTKRFIFSSTCATYGNPIYSPLDEKHPQDPINPYGESKLFIEKILKSYERAYGLQYVALRYFNAAGADPDCRIGESHDPETHLIPLTLQVAAGTREQISIYGTDYDTPDGTCIRDYIHVLDIADAHSLALERLRNGSGSGFYNLGSERGHSVREVVDTCERVSKRRIPHIDGPRRAGDPARLIASAEKAKSELGWQPKFQQLDEIVETAWRWEQRRHY